MKRLRIDSALVRHRFCIDNDPYFGNQVLLEEIQGRPSLIPVWALTPDGCEPEFDVRRTIEQMRAKGVKVAWISPNEHSFSPRAWCCGDLYANLQSMQIPLMVEYNSLPPDEMNLVCGDFPGLRVLWLNLPRLGRNRLLYPLLKQHQNIHLCFSLSFSFHEGFKDLCNRFGESRWVFGTGYPSAEGGAAIAGLMYSGLSESAIRAIASGNIARLLAEVKHE